MTDNQEVIIVSSNQEIEVYRAPTSGRGFTVEAVIGAWLDAVKGRRSGADKTQAIYRDTILKFRDMLRAGGLDLIPPEETEDTLAALADSAQIFARTRSARSRFKEVNVSKNTQAQRLAILSSFYDYALKRRHMKLANPIMLVDRPTAKAYKGAQALEPDYVEYKLNKIASAIIDTDPTQLKKIAALKRNLAILTIALFTGRRAAEITSLQRKHVRVNKNRTIQLFFETAKGGKEFKDTLSPEVSAILASWLTAWYGGAFFKMPDDTPVWVDIQHVESRPLGYHGLRGIVTKHLGESRVHVTRHTFAVLMQKAGASITDIQKLLGHENAATTGIYMQSLTGVENPYSVQLTGLIIGTRHKKR